MGYLFLVVAGWAAYGIFRMLRTGAENQKYLVESRNEAPLVVDHLSPPLAQLARDTRLLRISLEAPVFRVREMLVGDLDTASTEDLDSFDNMLMDLSRQLSDWTQMIDRLPPTDRATLQDLGLGPDAIRNTLIREGWSFDRKNLRGPGGPMDKRLEQVIAELHRTETMLQTQPRLYR